MQQIIFFTFLYSLFFSAPFYAEDFPGAAATYHGEPSSFVAGCVNGITGDYVTATDDLVIEGAVPLVFSHFYTSSSSDNQTVGWGFLPHFHIHIGKNTAVVRESSGDSVEFIASTFSIKQESYYTREIKTIYTPNISEKRIGSTNTSSGIISGRTHPSNRRIECLQHYYNSAPPEYNTTEYAFDYASDIVVFGDGGFRRFYNDKGILEKEELSNGCWIVYTADKEGRPASAKTVSPDQNTVFASATFHYQDKNCIIETSDGRKIIYRGYLLDGVEGDSPISRRFVYYTPPKKQNNSLLNEEWQGNCLKRKIFYEYGIMKGWHDYQKGKNRTREIFEPVGPNDAFLCTYRFEYHFAKWLSTMFKEDCLTCIHGLEGFKQEIQWSKYFRPHRISFYDINFSHRPLFFYQIMWGKEESRESGDLKTKVLTDPNGKALYVRSLVYDERHNPITVAFTGLLTGDRECKAIFPEGGETRGDGESYKHTYLYTNDGRNLVLEEREENGKIIKYAYLPGTSLLYARYTCIHDRIVKREFFEYDKNNLLIEERVEDGSTEDRANLQGVQVRQLKRIRRNASGLPERIEVAWHHPATGEEGVISGVIFHYDKTRAIRQDIYDSSRKIIYSLYMEYDSWGRLMGKTNPLGFWTRYTYDHLGRCSEIVDEASHLKTIYTYTAMGQIRTKEMINRNGEKRVEKFTYNARGFESSVIDHRQNTTLYKTDALGRVVAKTYPDGSLEKFSYDAMNNIVVHQNQAKAITEKTYNAYGSPLEIKYPDGGITCFRYNPDGSLREKIDALGTKTLYSYDPLERLLCKQSIDASGVCLGEERWEYSGLLLQKHRDAEGYVTLFTYDGYGRKIAEEKEGRRTYFFYDHLGRLCRTDHGEYLEETEFDLLDRVIVERIIAVNGDLQKEVQFVYDEYGNKKEIIQTSSQGFVREHFLYDGWNRLVKHSNASGFAEETLYDESTPHYLKKTTIDPLGTKKIELFGSMGRLERLELFSAHGERLLSESYTYNFLGGCTKCVAIVGDRIAVTEKEYDPMGRLLGLSEGSGEKITSYRYMKGGLLEKIEKNDGMVINHTYDGLGRILSIFATNGDGYSYVYDRLGRAVEVKDLQTGHVSKRSYHVSGEVEQEQFLHGLSLFYERDVHGRAKTMFLPDQTSVQYTYLGMHITSLSRIDRLRNHIYTHTFDRYDLLGFLAEATFLSGDKEYRTCDEAGRLKRITNAWIDDVIERRDEIGNILEISSKGFPSWERASFSYDALSQITSEKSFTAEHTYVFDAYSAIQMRDEKKADTNTLHQTLSDDKHSYLYNKAGSLSSDDSCQYEYDAFDRLIAVEKCQEMRAEYVYDAWHRRMQSKIYRYENGGWILAKTSSFLYDGNLEIGCVDEKGNMVAFRALGITKKAESFAAVALELFGRVYIPLHDIVGHVGALVDPASRGVVERYLYSAFGDISVFDLMGDWQKNSLLDNPWLYFGKRFDKESQLTYFGKRYYHHGKYSWISSDPTGPSDRPNLYAFLRGNPFQFFDPDGLRSIDIDAMTLESPSRIKEHTVVSQALESFFSAAALPFGNAIGFAIHQIPYLNNFIGDAAAFIVDNPEIKPARSQVYRIEGTHELGRQYTYVNGIGTSIREAKQVGRLISKELNNAEVYVYHGAPHGIIGDLVRAGIELHTPLTTHRENGFSEYLLNSMVKLAAENPSDYAHILLGFSEGGIVVRTGVESVYEVQPFLSEHIDVYTYGSAAAIPKYLAHRVDQRASWWDPVPLLDLVGRFSKDTSLTLVQPGGWLPSWVPRVDHSSLGGTAQRTWREMCKKIREPGESK